MFYFYPLIVYSFLYFIFNCIRKFVFTISDNYTCINHCNYACIVFNTTIGTILTEQLNEYMYMRVIIKTRLHLY